MKLFNFSESLPGNFETIHWGDWHWENVDCYRPIINRCIKYVQSGKNIFLTLGGDQNETIGPKDPRYSVAKHGSKKKVIQAGINELVELLLPIADRILWVMPGNHEWKKMNDIDMVLEICEKLGIADRASTYLTKADMGSFKIMDWHGDGNCNSRAGDLATRMKNEEQWVKKQMRHMAADCEVQLMHHIHKIRLLPPTSMLNMVDNGKDLKGCYDFPTRIPLGVTSRSKALYYIHEDHRWYASSGAALQTYSIGESGYGERRGYPPCEHGAVRTVVKNDKFLGVEAEYFDSKPHYYQPKLHRYEPRQVA